MRLDPPPAERIALQHFAQAFGRETFRHQRIVGPYIVDFFFPEERVIVEIDGDTHAGFRAWLYDAERDGFLRGRGYHVIRVPNEDVFQRPGWVVEQVAARLQRRASFFGRLLSGRTRL